MIYLCFYGLSRHNRSTVNCQATITTLRHEMRRHPGMCEGLSKPQNVEERSLDYLRQGRGACDECDGSFHLPTTDRLASSSPPPPLLNAPASCCHPPRPGCAPPRPSTIHRIPLRVWRCPNVWNAGGSEPRRRWAYLVGSTSMSIFQHADGREESTGEV